MSSEQVRGLMQEIQIAANKAMDMHHQGVMFSTACSRILEKIDALRPFWKDGSLDDQDAITKLYKTVLVELVGTPQANTFYQNLPQREVRRMACDLYAILYMAGSKCVPAEIDDRALEICTGLRIGTGVVLAQVAPPPPKRPTRALLRLVDGHPQP